MSKKYTLIIALAAAVIVVVLLVSKSNTEQQPTGSETPNPSGTVSGSPTPSSVFGASPAPFIGLTGLKSPATCKLEGELVFIAQNISENRNARITWNNVDISSRNITWTVTPKADISVGPNLFANLKLPNGTETITARLPDDSAPLYRARASVGYGELINGNVVVKNAPCSGEVIIRKAF